RDFANHRLLGGPAETTDAEQEQSDDPGVTHPMRRTQDTATGCVQQANSGHPLLPQAGERDRRAIRKRAAATRRSPGDRAPARWRATADAARASRSARRRAAGPRWDAA